MPEIVRLADLEPLARERLSAMAYDYIAGGAEDEYTLRENRRAFEQFQIVPRVLVDVSARTLATTVLGTPVSFPVLVAPMGFHALAHPDGELATARAAAAAGTIMIASTASNYSLEATAATGDAPRWFQLYVYRDREVTRSLVERAAAAGYRALCVTVDTPLVGRRERDIRNRFTLPPDLSLGNFASTAAARLPDNNSGSALSAYIASLWEPALTWEALDWLVSMSPLPVVIKGILSPDDARLAVEHGARGVVVSNHGGRQIDSAPGTLAMLPAVVDAVADRVEVLLDGGIRRGTDVLKALAIGARAVLLGRPIIWGLAIDGATGAQSALELLRAELDLALALSGCPSVADARSIQLRATTR